MAKRSARDQRINRELLDRARRQAAAVTSEEDEGETEAKTVSSTASSVPAASAPAPRATGAPRAVSTAKRLKARHQEARRKSMTHEEIAEILANPTKIVSEEELHAQYGFVLNDLRSMGLLAAASFGVLIVLAAVLPRGV